MRGPKVTCCARSRCAESPGKSGRSARASAAESPPASVQEAEMGAAASTSQQRARSELSSIWIRGAVSGWGLGVREGTRRAAPRSGNPRRDAGYESPRARSIVGFRARGYYGGARSARQTAGLARRSPRSRRAATALSRHRMKVLTRYLLRSHLAPFFFAFLALTGVVLINTLARELANLAGKGLDTEVFVEFFVLSLPANIALTLPMSVLVAVLYTFSQFAAENEITALKASGIDLRRMTL